MENPFIPTDSTRPSRKQTRFLAYLGREALYGGAAGGGKTDALLMAGLQFVEVPSYSALLLRRTFKHLSQSGGLIERSKDWLRGKAAWNTTDKQWKFPSGATLTFGYLDHERDLDNYQGGAWNFIGVDELTQFPENWYRYLFSRLRKAEGLSIPSRMRSASNPGNVGHEWVKRRFVSAGGKFFVSAFLADNPGLDQGDYIRSLSELDPITRAQLLAGDWDAYEGGRFKKEWFQEFYVARHPNTGDPSYFLHERGKPERLVRDPIHVARCWNFGICDPAATEDEVNDPTAIGMFAVTPDRDLIVLEVVREWLAIDRIVPRIADLCDDYAPLWVGIEDTGFQVAVVNAARRHARIPAVKGLSPEGKGKLVRATPAIIRCEAGQVFVPEQGPQFPWVEDFLAELAQFTGDEDLDAHDDQVDALAYAVQSLDRMDLGGPLVVEVEDSDWREEDVGDFGGMFGWDR